MHTMTSTAEGYFFFLAVTRAQGTSSHDPWVTGRELAHLSKALGVLVTRETDPSGPLPRPKAPQGIHVRYHGSGSLRYCPGEDGAGKGSCEGEVER